MKTENLTKEHLTEVQKYKVLNRTSFKNVSGNWQFNGNMTPERFIKILFSVLEESGSVADPKESELIKKLKSIQPDFDKLQSYQHGFHDGVGVAIDMVETYLLTIK